MRQKSEKSREGMWGLLGIPMPNKKLKREISRMSCRKESGRMLEAGSFGGGASCGILQAFKKTEGRSEEILGDFVAKVARTGESTMTEGQRCMGNVVTISQERRLPGLKEKVNLLVPFLANVPTTGGGVRSESKTTLEKLPM